MLSARMFLQLLPHLRGPLNGNSMTSKTLHDCVSLGYSARLKHFSLFRNAKFGVRVKNERRGELEGERFTGALSRIVGFAGKCFLSSPPPPPSPQRPPSKKRKVRPRGGKPTETIATLAARQDTVILVSRDFR